MKETPKKREFLTINGIQHDVTGRVIFHYRSCIKLFIKFKKEFYRPRNRQHEIDGEINPFRTGKTWYMPELVPSVSQVMYRYYYPTLNIEGAVNRAIHLLNENLHGRYDLAYIIFAWDVENNGKIEDRGRVLHVYKNGKEDMSLSKPLDFQKPEFLKWVKARELMLEQNFKQANFVIDYPVQCTVHDRKEQQLAF